jgi:hypothetical protein
MWQETRTVFPCRPFRVIARLPQPALQLFRKWKLLYINVVLNLWERKTRPRSIIPSHKSALLIEDENRGWCRA